MKNQLLEINKEKFSKSFQLFENIILKNPKFDSSIDYTSEELEIFDALTSRFVSIYETSIQLFKTFDTLQSLHVAESFSDLISNASKLNLIENEDVWFDMRLIRNKISHDYLPNQIQEMIERIVDSFYLEFKNLNCKL